MSKESPGYIPPEEGKEQGEESNELSPELKKIFDYLHVRLEVVNALFKLVPERAFDEALRELTLASKEDPSDEHQRMLDRYKSEIIKLIAEHYYSLPEDKKKLFEQLCIGIISPKK